MDWWIADLGRRVSIQELMILQGLNPADIPYVTAGMGERRIGHMVGNAMSVNSLECRRPRVLEAVGVKPVKPFKDRWVALVAGQ